MDIRNSSLFTKWKDNVSEVESFILCKRIAPLQQSFYFTNRSFTKDERFLWFYCAFPPSGTANNGRMLAVVDFEGSEVRYFPETQFSDASPMVDEETGEVYWVSGLGIWKRGPGKEDRVLQVNSFPEEMARNLRPYRISTHLTFSAHRKSLNIDAQIGDRWYLGEAPLDGEEIKIWNTYDRCYNHSQFNPVKPDVQLVAQDWWHDPGTGEKHMYQNRLWTIKRGEEPKPIYEKGSTNHAHEWWDADGEYVWYVDYEKGTERVNYQTGEKINVWPGGTCHSHCDASGRYLTGDIGTYSWSKTGCRVAFYNTLSGKEINIVSALPFPVEGRNLYHVDPHPQFCANDKYIVYTTTVLGYTTVAVTVVEDLVRLST